MRLGLIAGILAIGIAIGAGSIAADNQVLRGQSPLQATTVFAALVNAARERARTSSHEGVTIIFTTNATGYVKAVTYDGRPDLYGQLNAIVLQQEPRFPTNVTVSAPGIATGPPFSIVFNSDGSGEVTSWDPSQGLLSTEPTCAAGTQTIVFAEGSATSSAVFNCSTGVVASS